MKKKLISACLLGVNCKYNGKNNFSEALTKEPTNQWVPICPEQLAGLPTPRAPMEIKNGRVYNNRGEDLTEVMEKGAEECLKIARLFNCREAVLKQRSPSCGYGAIYDGSFSGKVVPGMGIAAKKLASAGIQITTEEDFRKGENHD